jgi:DNA-binding NtrC family response regulator
MAANSIGAAEALLRQETVHLAFLDLYLGTTNGLNVLDLIKVLQPNCSCVMMTAHLSF